MTPNEIHNKQFDKAINGYRPDEVNAFLADIASYVESIIEEKSETEQKLMVLAEKLEEYREDEDSLRAALIGAQKLGDSVVRESKRKAEQIIAEAQQKADLMVSNIRVNIDRETDTLNKMQAEVARFKSQMLSTYRQHIEAINAIPYDEKDFPKNKEHAHTANAPIVNPAKLESVKPAEEKPLAAEPEAKEFTVRFEDDIEYEEIDDELPAETNAKKESRHGDLLFGEKYPLTRKD